MQLLPSEKKSKDKHKDKHHKGDRHLVCLMVLSFEVCFDVLSCCECKLGLDFTAGYVTSLTACLTVVLP